MKLKKMKQNYIVVLHWTGWDLDAAWEWRRSRRVETVRVTADSYREALAEACRQCDIADLPYRWLPQRGGGVYGTARRRRHQSGVTRWEVMAI